MSWFCWYFYYWKKVLSAPSCNHFTAAKELWSQCLLFRGYMITGIQKTLKMNIICWVSPRSPKCNFLIRPLQAEIDWKEKYETLSSSSKNFGSKKNIPSGAAAEGRRPTLYVFSATQNCSDWCLSLVFFLSIHFGLQGRIRKLHFGDLGLTLN